ncbi:hypothetical protein DPEC_G00134830 [Dallia pectoralis]|uniref:Uncharacterized protein n=1 Tax=Dallia pectoralis TaxID=75939 RepID=A0ACC2GSK9_DALPE|nr:hypothetical protein DPEC_G00134830 [Dallia pectoralis]
MWTATPSKQYSYAGEWVHPKGRIIRGALDMGGASTQITLPPARLYRILPLHWDSSSMVTNMRCTHTATCAMAKAGHDAVQAHLLKCDLPVEVWLYSCFSYQPTSLVSDRWFYSRQLSTLLPFGYNLTTLGDLISLLHCVPVTFDPASEVTFTGTSNPQSCLNQMKNIVNLTDCALAPACGFNGSTSLL